MPLSGRCSLRGIKGLQTLPTICGVDSMAFSRTEVDACVHYEVPLRPNSLVAFIFSFYLYIYIYIYLSW